MTRKPTDRAPRLTERGEQALFAAWARDVARYRWESWLWCHVPNEGLRDARSGAALKRAGMQRGVPDILVFSQQNVARGGWRGLAIELKVKGGRVTPEQHDWIDALTDNGWLARVCYGAAEAIELTTNYMGGRI